MLEIAPDDAPRDRSSLERSFATPRHWLWLGLAAVLSSGLADVIAYRSRKPDTEWSAVALWAVGLLLWCLLCRTPRGERVRGPRLRRGDLIAMAALAASAAALVLPRLKVYPLLIATDAVRDGGLLARRIADGEITQVFDYGYYNGYSLLIPLLGVPFYLAYPASSLAFKGFAALAAIVAPPLFFWLARRFLPLALAALGAMVMVALPVYLFYARSEPVIALNPVLMTATLGALLPALEPDVSVRRLGLLGAVAGVSVYFHAGVKAAAFAALGLALLVTLVRACAGRYPWQRLVAGAAVALLGVLIGFGPLLQVTDPEVFLSRQRLGHPNIGFDAHHLFASYQASLRVFFDRPTMSWFPARQPLIPSSILAALFAFGTLFGFLALPPRVYWTLLFFVLLLPFTNSAITDSVNSDHRLTPLLPVIGFAIAAGIGVIWRGAERLRRVPAIRAVQAISVLLVLAAAAPPVYRFFSQQQARRPDLDTHLLWFAFQEIESTPALRNAPRLCVGGGAATTERMRMLHIRDAWSFYLPGKTIEPALLRPEAARNELYLSTTCEASTAPEAWTGKLYCSQSEPFVCPGPETRAADVRIFVDGRLAPSR